MSRLVFSLALPPEPRRSAIPLGFSLDVGLHAIVGLPEDGIRAIAPLGGGLVRPRSGQVFVDRRDPHGDPALRARIGVLAWEPMLPEALKVEQLFQACEPSRQSEAGEVLERLGLGALSERRLATLSTDEARAVELALALTTPEPLALFLTEPFANTAGASRAAVLEMLSDISLAPACVVVATASVADAVDLGGYVHLFEAGRITRSLAALDAATLPGRHVELRVTTSDPRRLAAALAGNEAISSVVWDEERGASVVAVRGADLDRVALAVARAAASISASIQSIKPVAPSLDELRAASSGLALAAYHAAYRYGSGAPPQPLAPSAPSVSPPGAEGTS